MTIQNLVDAVPVLRKIAAQEMSVRTLYKLSRMLNKLEEYLRFYETERQEILRKYCEKQDGKTVPRAGMEDKINERFRELLEFEVDLDGLEPVMIPAEEEIRLSYNDLQAVREFVRIGEQED